MALYAIGDLHLSFQVDKKMDKFGGRWLNHEEKVIENFHNEIKDTDTLVLVGDHSWGMKIEECEEDFNYIEQLPGRKILTRGNHDMFWGSNGTKKLNERFAGRLEFMQGQYIYHYEDYALIATKGYAWEGHDTEEHAEKLVRRELTRLQLGFDEAVKQGYEKIIVFLHYPPTNIKETRAGTGSLFTQKLEEYHVSQCIYGHCHGEQRWQDSLEGDFHGVEYHLVSGDSLDWHPRKILD